MLFRFALDMGCDSECIDATGKGHVLNPDDRYLLVNPSLAYNRSGQQNPGFSVFDSDTNRLQIIYLDLPQVHLTF